MAAMIEQQANERCQIGLLLRHRTGSTRDHVRALIEVISNSVSEVHMAAWRVAEEDRAAHASINTLRPCDQGTQIVIRTVQFCAPHERGPRCEPSIVPFRPRSAASVQWLSVSYREGPMFNLPRN
ncbi:hypothetical protein [Sabulicella rubraurantiaca]|uniref:hypothetical protein n=1 Tax=Sabulicella rubraurantiaca TaxID=2811429 RepID=UPI001A97AF9B|nr:hypothetical protein [Sabulicella rubraurantiaca]